MSLKTTTIGESLGIKPFKKRGGEAEIVSRSTNRTGEFVYTVRLLKSGRQRVVRREDLVVRKKQPKPRDKDGRQKRARRSRV